MDNKKQEKEQLIIRNFRLSADSQKDLPVIVRMNRLARLTERPPADIYRMALDKGILMIAAAHGIDPMKILEGTENQLASAG